MPVVFEDLANKREKSVERLLPEGVRFSRFHRELFRSSPIRFQGRLEGSPESQKDSICSPRMPAEWLNSQKRSGIDLSAGSGLGHCSSGAVLLSQFDQPIESHRIGDSN